MTKTKENDERDKNVANNSFKTNMTGCLMIFGTFFFIIACYVIWIMFIGSLADAIIH